MFNLTMLQAGAWTNYLLDLALLAALVVFAFLCAKKGFIECFFSFVSGAAAFLVAILFSKLLIGATGGLFGLKNIFTNTFQNVLLKIQGFDLDVSVGGLQAALEAKSLPSVLVDMILDKFGNASIPAGTTLANLVGQTLSGLVVSLIGFVITFIAARFLMNLLKKVLKLLASKISLLGTVDQLLGATVGLISGWVIASAVLGVLAMIPSEAITVYFNNSLLIKWMYNHNIIYVILGWIVA